MATTVKMTKAGMELLLREAHITKPELSERLGHWVSAAHRWGENPPRYVVAYLKLRKMIFDVVAHLEFGTVPDDFNFSAALREMGMRKTELARIIGVTKHTVSRWGDNPPLYVREYVYTRYLIHKGLESGKQQRKRKSAE